MSKRIVLGVHIQKRTDEVPPVQHLFTEYGCYIKTRIGLHQVMDDACSPAGLILLEMFGDPSKATELQQQLNNIDGVTVKSMDFEE